jgi:hypothetical protein
MDRISRRQGILENRIKAHPSGAPAILCIPASMTTDQSRAIADDWRKKVPSMAVIVANATPQHPSVIWFQNAPTVCSDNKVNEIQIQSLA